MVRAGSSSGVSRPASGLLWTLPAVATAVCTAVVCAVVSGATRAPIAWSGLVATVAVALVSAAAVRRGRSLTELRVLYAEQDVALKRRLSQQEAETVRLAEVLLPDAVARLQKGEFPEDVLTSMATSEAGRNPDFQAAHRKVLRSVLEAVSAEEDLRDAAQRAFVNIARRVQAIIHQQAQDLREMEDRHGHTPEVFGDLLRLDHGTALVGRLADSIAVLGGARPGRQWSRAVPLFSVLRGAMSRILDYQRVELHSVSEIAVIGPTVEPLIHALAELLDNATRYSPPQTRVHLTAVEVQSGIAVEIEDGGVSLSEEARMRAERMLEQAQAGIDLNDLGETPRLGLAVVGRLSQAYGFQVSLRPSAYGGVRAVLIVPQEHLTTATATGRAHGIGAVGGTRAEKAPPRTTLPRTTNAPGTGPRQSPPMSAPSSSASVMDDDQPVVTERTANGLPQRRRRAPGAPTRPADPRDPRAAAAPAAAGSAPAATGETVEPGIWLAAFTSGVSGEPAATSSAREKSDESLDKGETP
ncbi:ATP-binding protein [Streptomyces sp. SL13]|uniref:histidine kinase n=1 Tax=Streptantibioticus silvisoli TaxID=2705255 RepID=A0AA90KHB8_9ACTN|nr:ATP-binding protein [Streptantibioticus silvisoli]MDI5966254.1 ATP-binding protein [Streptantibioticus silvisoli]MDI5971595.1 ATP-binding protein [Streptantibioticus silvisoli]